MFSTARLSKGIFSKRALWRRFQCYFSKHGARTAGIWVSEYLKLESEYLKLESEYLKLRGWNLSFSSMARYLKLLDSILIHINDSYALGVTQFMRA